MKFLQLKFLPQSSDFALLVLRVWFSAMIFYKHGLMKLMNFADMGPHFPDPINFGHWPSFILVIFAETVCATLLALGWLTRFAALVLTIEMVVLFTRIHHGALSGPNGGELPFLYLGAFVTLFIAGGGRFSLDGNTGAK